MFCLKKQSLVGVLALLLAFFSEDASGKCAICRGRRVIAHT